MGSIAVIGWGSLVWDPRELALRTRWRADGPCLPVEFARRSIDDRVTLVLTPGSPAVRTYWAESRHARLDEAVADLAAREGSSTADIGRFPGTTGEGAIAAWLRARPHLTAAVWTALPWTFTLGVTGVVDAGHSRRLAEQVLAHLGGLDGPVARRAREYVEHAPPQTVTPVRRAIEQALGWQRRPLPARLCDGPVTGPPCP